MSRKRKEARKRISKRLKTKRLIKKYGNWIAVHSDWTGEIIPDYTEYDAFLYGWRDLWHMCINELNPIIHRLGLENSLYFVQIKEKFGELRVYMNYCVDEVEDVLSKYSIISGNVCQWCGRPDSPTSMGGWIDCKCKQCDSKEKYQYCTTPYEERYNTDPDKCRIPETRKYSYLADGKRVDMEIDISDTVNEYRERWERKEQRKQRRHKMHGLCN